MKTALRSLLLIAIITVGIQRANAQCEVSEIVIQNAIPSPLQEPGTCAVKFDVSFTIDNNNGNKFIFIHAWAQSEYPDYFNCMNGGTNGLPAIQAPDSADLGNPFLTIAIDNSGDEALLLSTYTPDPTVAVTPVDSVSRIVLPTGEAVFILYGVSITLPGECGSPLVVEADIWSSQAARAQVAHCVNCGLRFSAGFVSITGFVNCFTLKFHASITNHSNTAIEGYYRVFADANQDGFFNPLMDTVLIDTTSVTVAAGVGVITNISGDIPTANFNQNVFLLFTQTSGAASGASVAVLLFTTQCAPLPVVLSTFTAQRIDRSNVMLKWETATEINNRGFAIQRNLGNNKWQTMAFVATKAQDGNSTSTLRYEYNDINANKGISQYRIQQIELDGAVKLSAIRSVRGEGQIKKTIVYPNPSADGRINIVFEDNESLRDVNIIDMSGRMIRNWKAVSGNTLQVDNLDPGMYSIRIFVKETGIQVVEKVVVSKR